MSDSDQPSHSEPNPWWMLSFEPGLPLAWAYVPRMTERILAFTELMDSRADGPTLAQQWRNHFVVGSPELFAIGVMRETEMVGHLLCQAEKFYSEARYLTVLQYQLDQSPPNRYRLEVWQHLRNFALAQKMKCIYALCPDERVAKAHSMFRGFKHYSTVMVHDLAQPPRGEADE